MATVWPPEFFVLPDGSGIVKGDAKPCGVCGANEFIVVQTAIGQRAQCQCVKVKRGEKILGVLDRVRWVLRKDDSK